MKKIYIIITILLLFSQALFSQWTGSGTEQDPFKIYTVEDLENITTHQYDSEYLDYIRNSYTDIHFELMNDIESPLTHILCEYFHGYFHGKGHFITLEFNSPNLDDNILLLDLGGTMDSLTLVGSVFNFNCLFLNFCPPAKLSYITCNLNITPFCVYNSYLNAYYAECNVWGFNINVDTTIEHCVNNSNLHFTAAHDTVTNIQFCFFPYNNCSYMKNCINNGNIILNVNALTNVSISCFSFTGGAYICTILDCINTGDIRINGVPNTCEVSCFINSRGSVSRCLNTGNIYAKKVDKIGTFVNYSLFSVSNCLNTGKIIGEDIAGGIVGNAIFHSDILNDFSYIENCVNAGEIIGNILVGGIAAEFEPSTNHLFQPKCFIRNNIDLTRTSKYALFGDNIADLLANYPDQLFIENNFYDKQMVTQLASPSGDIPGVAEGLLTTEMTGFALQNILGNGWSYAEGRYPIPLGLEHHPAALLAATPVYLHYTDTENYNTVDSVSQNFTVGLENNVEWQADYGNVILQNENGLLQNNGYERLTANLENYTKNVHLNIKLGGEPQIYHAVSGTVTTMDGNPLANVRITYTGGTTTTNNSGYYSFTVLENTSVTITPSLAGYTFTPTNPTITVTENTTVNFTATSTAQTYYTVSGTVTTNGNPLANVRITYTGGTTTTNNSGYYSFTVLANTSVTITPSLEGYTFSPQNISLGNVTQNYENQNFTATSISTPNITFNNLVVYPNPSKGSITVKLPDNNENTQIKIYNKTGACVYSQTTSNNEITIDIHSFAPAAYLLECTNGNVVNYSKIVIND